MINSPITIVILEDGQFVLEVQNSRDSAKPARIHAGSIGTIKKQLQHEPATAYELEAAIETVENSIMPIIPSLPQHSNLVTCEAVYHDLVNITGQNFMNDEVLLDITTVEEIFNRLVDVAYGIPASRLGIPEKREFAAALVFLRELMHHGSFETVLVKIETP